MSTLSERILGAPAGEYVDHKVDRAYVHDGTGVLTLETWKQMGSLRLSDANRLYVLFDHIVPANNSTTATLQHELREFACSSFLQFSDIGGGICHQIMSEGVVLPGEVVVGADSHSCTLGAFGAFATGVGATDMAAIWLTGETWFRVPDSIGIHLTGSLQGGAEAKDLALSYVSRLGMDGGTYCALEFVGDGAGTLGMEDRLVLTNLSVETGAKTGLFYADEVTGKYLAAAGSYGAAPGTGTLHLYPQPRIRSRGYCSDGCSPAPGRYGETGTGSCRSSHRPGLCRHLHERAVFGSCPVCPDCEREEGCSADDHRPGIAAGPHRGDPDRCADGSRGSGMHHRHTGLWSLPGFAHGCAGRGGGLPLHREPEFQEPDGYRGRDLSLIRGNCCGECP